MIGSHQPSIFPENEVIVGVSSVDDGSMTISSTLDGPGQVQRNRESFIKKAGGDLPRSALIYVTFDGVTDYCRYREVAPTDLTFDPEQPADALVTRTKNVGLFLPIADCCGAVIYDPRTKTLMLSHLGRHSTEQFGGKRSVEHLQNKCGVQPKDVLVWLSPAVGAENYPIHARGNHALKDLVKKDLIAAGVKAANIEVSPIETDKDPNYFSHSQSLKGEQTGIDGRFAVFAMMQK